MATGGDVSGRKGRSVYKDSDDLIIFLCCVCKTEKKRTEAVKYCVNCEDYFCAECVKLHFKVPALSRHVIVGKSDFKGMVDGNELPSIPTERCAAHPAKIVDMYCETHDRVGCATCMATLHGESCVKLYIPENIDFLFNTEKIKQSEKQLRSAIQKLEAALRLRVVCLQDLRKVIDDARKQLEFYTDKLMKNVTELKRKTKDKLDLISNELESVFSEQSSALNKELAVVKDILQKTTCAHSESNNKSQQIVCSNLASVTIDICEDANKCRVCPDIKEISFQPSEYCEKLFDKLLVNNSLGEFSLLPSLKQSTSVLYKIVKSEKTSVKEKSDEDQSICDITGSCTLQNGTILMADITFKCLKRLSPRATSVSDCLNLPGCPRSVAVINQKEVAVTLPDLKQVHIIGLDTIMKTTRTVKLNFEGHGITHYNNELFISDSGYTVFVYTLAGNLLGQFSRDNAGQTLFSNINAIAVSDNGRLLFVADCDKGLIAIERESGKQLWCYTGDDLKRPTGVCVDGKGGVLVCGFVSNNVLQFSESGEKIGEVVTRAEEIERPASVCFVTDTSILAITQDYNDVAMQYQLTT